MTLEPAVNGAHGAGAGEKALTSDRDETKYLVERARVPALVQALARCITPYEHVGRARPLPSAHHFTTTIYFDTASRTLYRAARADGANNVKVRAREYYDLHPSLAELATDPESVLRYEPALWFELKRRSGTRTSKHRFCLDKIGVPAFFAGEDRDDDVARGEALPALRAFLEEVGEPLAASSLVSYRRLSFQDENAHLRITVDVDLAYFSPPPDLWSSERALSRSRLGTPRGRDHRGLVEVKRLGASEPGWLEPLLASAGARAISFSKFEEAERAVRGP
jgi:hypothetical protein